VTPGDADATILGNGQGAARPANSKGVALKFNGIDNTVANVQSGRYTLWVYNRIVVPKPQDGNGTYSGVIDKDVQSRRASAPRLWKLLPNRIKTSSRRSKVSRTRLELKGSPVG
jgi:hypothetical protein